MQVVYGLGEKPLEISRLQKNQERAVKGQIDPDNLSPTEDATFKDSLRVYLQIAIWKSLNTSFLHSVGREWEMQCAKNIKPRMLSDEITPPYLMKRICCTFQEGDK